MEIKKIVYDAYKLLSKYNVVGLKVYLNSTIIDKGDTSGEPITVELSKGSIFGELFFNEKATKSERKMAEEILQVTLHSLNINFDLSEQISDIKKLGNLTKLISSNLNLSNVIKELLGAGMEITGVNHTSILLIDPDKMAKGMAYEMYRYDPELHTYYSTARMTRGIAHRVITTKKPVLVENLKKLKNASSVGLKKGRKSVLAIPLIYKNKINGIFYADSTEMKYFDKELLERMEFIASQASVALGNARLYEEVTRRLEALSLINRVSNALVQTIELKKMLKEILKEVVSIFKLQYGRIFLYDDKDESFKSRVGIGYKNMEDVIIPLNKKSIITESAKRKEVYYAPDVTRDPFYAKVVESIGSEIAIPLHIGETLLGVMVLSSEEKEWFDENDIILLSSIANNISMAVQNAKLFENTRRLSMIDPLTGVYNRRKATSVIEQEIKRSSRFSRMFSILFIDLDNFKQYNDENGHMEGDKALRDIAKILRGSVREIDILSRYGGDEFLAILMETSTDYAVKAAERIRKSMKDYKKREGITLSIGIATFPTNGKNLKNLLHNADRACYNAKAQGGDKVLAAKIK
ncbi:sensor domain-containing diguanylate cyclase [candidate division WOR-3 bacterium]|nr:sensor domain-containing diguanylate cyclase [candidate division WOR-3 bacterium]